MGDTSGGIKTPPSQSLDDEDMEAPQNLKNNPNMAKETKNSIKYKNNSLGPYTVIVQGNTQQNLGNYHPLAIAKELHRLNIQHKRGPLKKGKNRIIIEFDSPQAANNFLNNKDLKNKGYEIYIPNVNVTCKGIVKSILKDLTEEELVATSECRETKIIEVKRFNRVQIENSEKQYIKTGTCLYTFEGKILPRTISVFGLEMLVEPYIMRVKQCYNCLLYGHIKSQCKGKEKCQNCTKTHEGKCSAPSICYHCQSIQHISTSKDCPEHIRQKQIRTYMSINSMTFYDANLLVPKVVKAPNITDKSQFPTLAQKSIGLSNTFSPLTSHPVQFSQDILRTSQLPSYSNMTNRHTSFKKRRANTPSPTAGYNKDAVFSFHNPQEMNLPLSASQNLHQHTSQTHQ